MFEFLLFFTVLAFGAEVGKGAAFHYFFIINVYPFAVIFCLQISLSH